MGAFPWMALMGLGCGSSRERVDGGADSDADSDAAPVEDAGGEPCEDDGCPGTCEAHYRLTAGAPVQGDSCTADNSHRNCLNGEGGADVVATFSPPASGRWRFDTRGSDYDTTLGVSETCGGMELGCNDDFPDEEYLVRSESTVIVDLGAGRTYWLLVDALFEEGCGAFSLRATGPLAPSCTEVDPCADHDECCSGVCDVLCLLPDQ